MRVDKHKAVYITYTICDEAGAVIEQSDVPVGYVHGSGSQLVPKVEGELDGCEVGEVVEVTVTPEEGFGPHQPELTYTDDIDNVPPQFRHLGAEVQMQNDAGEVRNFVVSRIEDGKLTVDGNHPFAGRTVIFRVTIVDVRDATPAEIAQGRPVDSLAGAALH